jgi:hypothetical protein
MQSSVDRPPGLGYLYKAAGLQQHNHCLSEPTAGPRQHNGALSRGWWSVTFVRYIIGMEPPFLLDALQT